MIDLSDPRQFNAEYERHFSGLLYFAMRYVGREDAACDIIQNFFVRLWEIKGTFGDANTLTVYIYRSVRNRCLTWLRDDRRRAARMAGMELPVSEESFLGGVIEAEVYSLVNAVFAELPEASRRVYARSLEGKSHKEIAAELNIAVNTVKRHKNNANHYLRLRLRRLFMLLALAG